MSNCNVDHKGCEATHVSCTLLAFICIIWRLKAHLFVILQQKHHGLKKKLSLSPFMLHKRKTKQTIL